MQRIYFIILLALISISLFAQEEEKRTSKKEPPAIKLLRAEENYTYLADKENNPYEEDIFDAIKFIPLNQEKDFYLSFGGQIRPRFELYSNRFWETEADENYYSQRLALYSNIVLGKHVRIFGEIYHGYTSHEEEFAEYDEIDFFQAFAEFNFPLQEGQNLTLRFGRQEMGFGAARLVGIREGPNIRRSFDACRIIYKNGATNIQAFYGKEVRPLFDAFDNKFSLFDGDATNPQLWGLYTQFKIKGVTGMNELYYLGFHADNTTFNDVTGDETRHSIGLRRFGKLGKRWNYNSEVTYQFGEIGEDNISAFNIETNWHYELINTKWKINPGLKLEFTSGDKDVGDGKINTFNPMFVNPAYYSLAATITPVNMMSIHPSISVKPTEKLKLYVEWAFFWRASKEDALYQPTRFVNRPTGGITDKSIGNQLGIDLEYEFCRNLSFAIDMTYFITGEFLEMTGEAVNTFHIAPTLSFKF